MSHYYDLAQTLAVLGSPGGRDLLAIMYAVAGGADGRTSYVRRPWAAASWLPPLPHRYSTN